MTIRFRDVLYEDSNTTLSGGGSKAVKWFGFDLGAQRRRGEGTKRAADRRDGKKSDKARRTLL
jgi:hypothetical protein